MMTTRARWLLLPFQQIEQQPVHHIRSIPNTKTSSIGCQSDGIVVPNVEMKAQGYCHFNKDGRNTSFSIKLFEMDLVIEQDPDSRSLGHGAVVWDAAVVLSKYMEKNYKDYDYKSLANKTVLELGSGCGLAGMAFMMKGSKVTYTDMEKVTKSLTEKNVEAIYAKLKASSDPAVADRVLEPTVYPIDWTHNPICQGTHSGTIKSTHDKDKTAVVPEGGSTSALISSETDDAAAIDLPLENMHLKDDTVGSGSAGTEDNRSSFDKLVACAPYDYVLLTDCVFSAELAVPLVNTILCCCGPRTDVICCHEIRDEDANAVFVATLSKYFTVKRVPKSKLHEKYSNDMIEIIMAKPHRTKK